MIARARQEGHPAHLAILARLGQAMKPGLAQLSRLLAQPA
jgi:hypothetical protein